MSGPEGRRSQVGWGVVEELGLLPGLQPQPAWAGAGDGACSVPEGLILCPSLPPAPPPFLPLPVSPGPWPQHPLGPQIQLLPHQTETLGSVLSAPIAAGCRVPAQCRGSRGDSAVDWWARPPSPTLAVAPHLHASFPERQHGILGPPPPSCLKPLDLLLVASPHA